MPAFNLPALSNGGSPTNSDSPSRGHTDDEMAEFEAAYQESGFHVGEEVDYFASELDRHRVDPDATPSEQRSQILRLVESYSTYMRNRANRLHDHPARQMSARDARWQRGTSTDMDIDDNDDGHPGPGAEELRRVEEEAQTWDLLRRMLPLTYRDPAKSAVSVVRTVEDRSPTSRSRWWNDFLISDSFAKERKVVLEWLQNSASYGPPVDEVVSELQHSAERGDILAHGWLHTRSKIKLQKSVNGYQGVLDPNDQGAAKSHLASETLVTQLDPDAITRQVRKVEPQDEFFERAIWLGCFEMLRRGYSMAEIRDWCAVRTETWRAATISPLPLSNPEDEEQEGFDPPALVRWRRMCFATARDGGTSDYDRAVYGLLAGDLESVLKVCKSWDDYVFANYNAILRSQFDSFLVKHADKETAAIAQQFPVFNTALHTTDPTTANKRLVASLETNEATREEAQRISKVLQGAIIAKELDQHMYYQGLVLSKHANRNHISKLIPETASPVLWDGINMDKYSHLADHENLRLLAHILVIVNTLDGLTGFSRTQGPLASRHVIQEHIIVAYISYLRLAGLEEMIPLYASKLSSPRVYDTLSRNLIHLDGQDRRLRQIAIMQGLGLDTRAFGLRQTEMYLEDVNDLSTPCEAKGQFKVLEEGLPTLKYGRIVKPDFFGEDPDQIDGGDEQIIRAMEWLLLIDGLFLETCNFAIRVYKYFLKRTQLRAARALSTRVPAREIIRRKTKIPMVREDPDSSASWFEEFKETRLPEELVEEYNTTEERLNTTVRNLWELEALVRALDAMETISSAAGLTREESGSARDIWQHTGKEVRKAKTYMEPVLKEWLLTTNEVDRDFHLLREAYIPETVLAYISSLHFAGTSMARDNLLECMELAAVIAEKNSNIAHEFIKSGRMKELVEAFASCSKALAIWTSDNKKGSQTSSKKIRELGWSRELWSVKP